MGFRSEPHSTITYKLATIGAGSRVKTDGPIENPLISNEKLRQIYTAMVQTRIFTNFLVKLSPQKSEFKIFLGQEACRISSLIDLKEGDFVSDSKMNPATDLILGAELQPLLRETIARLRRKTPHPSNIKDHSRALQLSPAKDPADRLTLALGTALSVKASKRNNTVVAFAQRGEINKSTWKRILTLAQKLELPVIFVVLPSETRRKKSSTPEVCGVARSVGIPGVPIDATDAVASYRVVQESMGRTRGGDGPVVIECLVYRLPEKKLDQRDPVLQMENLLLERKISNKAWIRNAVESFEKRVNSLRLSR
jgi:TPP-dependent pyruvate/acetoin dehydrogenase alpha subunit